MEEKKKKKSPSSKSSTKKKNSPKKVNEKKVEKVEEVKDEIKTKKKSSNNNKKDSPKKSSKEISKTPEHKRVKEEEYDDGISIGAIVAVIAVIVIVVILMLLKGCNKEKDYTVKFDTNGGNTIADQVVGENGTVSIPTVPTREGYTFVGWYVGDEEYDFDTKVTSDLTIEARWEPINDESEEPDSKEDSVLTGISLDNVTIKPNESSTLTINLEPSDADVGDLIWSSADTSIVTVDANGKIKAVGKGSTTITVTTKDGKHKATCKVTVSDDVVKVTKVTLDKHDITMSIGGTTTIDYTISPKNASNKNVTWSSSDTSIATVDKYGKITAKKSGKATITVTTNDGKKKDTITVRVRESASKEVVATSIKISGSNTVQEGSSITLTATISPSNATNKTVTWSVSDTNIATIKNGVLTGKKAGTVTVTAKTSNGKTATYKVTVTAKPVVYSYVLTLKTHYMSDGKTVANYVPTVTRNGVKFTSFAYIKYGSNTITPGAPTVSKQAVDKNGTVTSTIYLDQNTSAKITVIIEK